MNPPTKRHAYEVTFLVAYDLPSENIKALKHSGFYHQVESVRSTSVQFFHKLGVQTTESVILIAPEHEKQVKETIELVTKLYAGLQHDLNVAKIDVKLDPMIRIIGLSSAQTRAYRDLAVRYIEKKAAESGDYLEAVMERLEELKSPKAIRKALKNLERHRKGWAEIQSLVCELSLSNDWDIPRILNQIDRVISRVEKGLGE